MKRSFSYVGLLISFFAVGCSSSTADDHDMGDVKVGTYSIHVVREGGFANGTDSKYAIKPNAPTGKPDVVNCWWGAEKADVSTHVTASYDGGDMDFDCHVTTAVTPAAGDQLWIALTFAGVVSTGSVTVTP